MPIQATILTIIIPTIMGTAIPITIILTMPTPLVNHLYNRAITSSDSKAISNNLKTFITSLTWAYNIYIYIYSLNEFEVHFKIVLLLLRKKHKNEICCIRYFYFMLT